MESVVGRCPMGCGRTLFLAAGGHITCSLATCPEPGAVDALLAVGETEHVVHLERHTFTIQHPLRERLQGGLFNCGLHQYLSDLGGPPNVPGMYRVKWSVEHGASLWDRLSDETIPT